ILTYKELSVFENKEFKVPSLDFPFTKEFRVIDMLEDKDTTLWFATATLINFLTVDGKHGQLKLPSMLEGNKQIGRRPRLLFVNEQNELGILYENRLLWYKEEKIVRSIELSFTVSPSRTNTQFLLLKNGLILYNSPEGLISISPNGKQEIFFASQNSAYQFENIKQLFQDSDENLWIGFESGGLLKLNMLGGSFQTENFLPKEKITNISEDLENNLWISTQNSGVYLLSRNALEVLKIESNIRLDLAENQQLLDREIIDFEGDESSGLFIALEKEVFLLQEQSKQYSANLSFQPELLEREKIEDILLLESGRLLIKSQDRLFACAAGNCGEVWELPPIKAMSRANDGKTLLTFDLESSIRLADKDFEKLLDKELATEHFQKLMSQQTLIPSMPGTRMIQEGIDGILYGIRPNGIYRIIDGKKMTYPKNQPIFNASIYDLAVSADSLLWIASNGSGLIAVKGEIFSTINKEDGLEGLVCYELYIDEETSKIWVGTQTGLGRISSYDFEKEKYEIKWFNTYDGLGFPEVKKIKKYRGLLWVAGEKGISILDEKSLEKEHFAPPAYITGLSTSAGIKDGSKDFYSLGSNARKFAIHFTGISYRNLHRLDFSYKLNEEEWSPVPSNPLSFSNLGPGQYTIQLKAKSRDGLESIEADQVQIELVPTFLESKPFKFLAGLAILTLLIGIIRYLYIEKQKMMLEDLVEEKTYELNLKIEELHRSNQDLKQFAYVASHDLKTPLRTVIVHLQLLKKKWGESLDIDGNKAMNFAVDSSKGMYAMIDHLLDYSRLGRESLEFEEFNLADILIELEKNLEVAIKEKNAILSYSSFPNFVGVPAQWKILFQNLIENGIKFNESEQPEIKISYKDSPDFWILSVKDNGIGIKEEYQPKIFDLFQRLNKDYAGSGIGLAKCKKIVEIHGGSIWIDSVEGSGTNFQFTIAKRLGYEILN
ncbi:MAG: ATP-binding protein, partial [Bacteroidota bacterium]